METQIAKWLDKVALVYFRTSECEYFWKYLYKTKAGPSSGRARYPRCPLTHEPSDRANSRNGPLDEGLSQPHQVYEHG